MADAMGIYRGVGKKSIVIHLAEGRQEGTAGNIAGAVAAVRLWLARPPLIAPGLEKGVTTGAFNTIGR